jgi:PAS domain S-box-containing protein
MTTSQWSADISIESVAGEEALWRLATVLGRSVTPMDVAESLANEGALAAGGVFANMAVLLSETHQVRVVHRSVLDPDSAGTRDFDLGHQIPACEAIRSGEPVLLGTVEEIADRFPDALADVYLARLAARASLPLHSTDRRVIGAVGFGWQQPQTFDATLLRRLDLIAQLAGLALERALRGGNRTDQTELVQALETMPNAFFNLDPDLCITHVNAEGARLLRSSSEELTGLNLLDVFPGAIGGQFETQYRHAIESGQPVVFEEHSVTLDTWFEVHAWPAQQGLNVYFADISDRRNTESQRSTALTDAMIANHRLRLLTEVAAQLAGAEDRADVFERLSHVLVPGMADWCTIIVPGNDELVRVAAKHRQPALDSLAKRLVGTYPHSYDGPSPGVVAYRSGKPLRLAHLAQEIVDNLDNSTASAGYGRTLQLLGDGPGLLTPVPAGDQVQAVITLTRSSGDPFTDEDVAAMVEAASRVEAALVAADHLQTERETARALQAAALPSSLPSSPTVSLAATYRAASGASHVGGDWYDAFELETGRIALVVGDVAGHGLGAAALTAQMRNALRAHLFGSIGPLESLSRLSRLIATQEPGALATIICAELDPVSGAVTWASAGHPAPILVSNDGTSAHLSGRPIPPIGCPDASSSEGDAEYRATLRPGDRLMLFTDGLFERRKVNLDIGLAHLMIVAEQALALSDPAAACEAVLEGMLSEPHEDDVCLLIADFAG